VRVLSERALNHPGHHKLRKLLVGTAALAGAAFLASASDAAAQRATQNYGNFYVGIAGGATIPQDVDFTFSGAVAATGKFSFKTGAAITGEVGYHYNDLLAAEVELGYTKLDFDKFSVAGVTASANGHIDTVVGFVNAIVTPLGRSTFTPYIGGGLGFAHGDTKFNSLTIGGVTTPINTSSNGTDFAANALIGADYALTSNFLLGARYRFVWINDANTQSSGGVTVKQGDITAHVITANLTYRF
jgi:opacity protein-like surface antigen